MPIRNVRDFGALGDNITDDTLAFQTAFNDASGPVYIPTGLYKISRPLTIKSVIGFKLYGDGPGSKLMTPGKMSTVLDINGALRSTFADFSINGRGTGQVDNVLCFNTLGSQCRFLHVDILNFASFDNAFAINEVDSSYFEHCTVVGNKFGTGFLFGSGVSHMLIHPMVSNCQYGIVGRGTLPLTSIGGNFNANEFDFCWHSAGPLSVTGLYSNRASRLYTDGGPTQWDSSVSFRDCLWSGEKLHPDGEFVCWYTGGRLCLDGTQIVQVRSGIPATIATTAYAPLWIDLRGVLCPTPPEDIVQSLGPPDNVRTTWEGYRILDPNGGPTTWH